MESLKVGDKVRIRDCGYARANHIDGSYGVVKAIDGDHVGSDVYIGDIEGHRRSFSFRRSEVEKIDG